MRTSQIIRGLLAVLAGVLSFSPIYAADCSSYGDDIPAADISLNADHLYQDMSIELGISTNQATQLRLFYYANGKQFAVSLPPVPLTPPTQTYKVNGIKLTTTFFLVAKRSTSSTICALTVHYRIPVDIKTVSQQQECPAGYGIGGYRGNGQISCVRVLPPYDDSQLPDFEPVKNPPGTNVKFLCQNNGYYVVWMRASSPVFGPLCRNDNFNGTDPFSSSGTYNATPREDFPYGVPGQVRVIIGRAFFGPAIYLYISRQLEVPADAQGTGAANQAAISFANPPPAH